MKCLKPVLIDTDEIDLYPSGKLYVPCGKCEACRNSDSLSWRIRLKEHFRSSNNAYFVTLTYDDNHLPFRKCTDFYGKEHIAPTVNKKDVQNFFKRFRRRFEECYGDEEKKFSYFLVSEYGPTTYRPHYHAILFNVPKLSYVPNVQDFKITEEIYKIWGNGFIKLDKCNESRIAYCTKYMSCVTEIPDYLPKPFRLISKGIGINFLNKEELVKWYKKTLANYYQHGLYKLSLPRYYKDKLFDEDDKRVIRELNYIRLQNEENHTFHYSFEPGAVKALKDKQERIRKFKRIYYQRSLKRRKDI